MVHALQEAHRVLPPSALLLDVRPLIQPIVVELRTPTRTLSTMTLDTYSAPEDITASDVALEHARSKGWFLLETIHRFSFDIDCDTAAELRDYAESRKLEGAPIPYSELDALQQRFAASAQPTRLRCRRPWALTTYRRR